MISRPRSPRSRPWFSQRCQLVTAALILSAASGPLAAQRPAPAQRGGTPRADTPQLVVSALSSRDPALGVQAADAIRKRMQNDHSATELYVIPQSTIDQTLRASGYNPDSALGAEDIVTLARQVRGDYALAGTVERTPSGVRTSIRVVTQAGAQIIAEPLAPIDGADFGDIAKQVDRAVTDALRALSFYHDCSTAARTGDYQKAMTAAQQGLRLRPTSAALNSCVLSILTVTHATPDSIVAVASAIVAADSSSQPAWASLADAYQQRGDSARALAATRMLHRLDPMNVIVTSSLVDQLVTAGHPDTAAAVLDTALQVSPTNAALLRKEWLLQLHLGQYAAALATGTRLVAADSSAATADFYERQIAAARGANDSGSVHRLAQDASARFPKDTSFLLILARDAIDRGAPREALTLTQRVLAIAPANTTAWQLSIASHASADGPDSAITTARRALAAHVPSDAVSTSLLAVVTPLLARAQQSGLPADWEAVLSSAQAVDSVASSPQSNFYVGASAFQIAASDVQSLSAFSKLRAPTRAQRQAACTSAKRADDLLGIAAIAVPKGGRVNPTAAAQIMAALPGYTDFVGSAKRSTCR